MTTLAAVVTHARKQCTPTGALSGDQMINHLICPDTKSPRTSQFLFEAVLPKPRRKKKLVSSFFFASIASFLSEIAASAVFLGEKKAYN